MLVSLRHPESAVPPVTHFRSTGTVAALRILGERGLRARYQEHLDPAHRRTITEMVPAEWVPAEAIVAHFRAVDRLGLSTSELLDLGTSAGEGVVRFQTSTLLRMTRELGVTPWPILRHAHRMWDRMCRGGDVTIERVGPKEVLTTLHHGLIPLSSSAYFRTMLRGVFQAGLSLWCTRCYVTDAPAPSTSLAFREAWV
jgi:hypothetical protein